LVVLEKNSRVEADSPLVSENESEDEGMGRDHSRKMQKGQKEPE